MAVIVNGYEMRTLQQPIYLGDGRQVMEVWVNGTKVYPEGYSGVVFLVDTTGSMSASSAANAILSVYERVGLQYASLIEFKDELADGESSTRQHLFNGQVWTTSVEDIVGTVKGLSYSGGGDGPETPHHGILMAAEYAGPGMRIVVITDNEYKDYEIGGTSYVMSEIQTMLTARGISVDFMLV